MEYRILDVGMGMGVGIGFCALGWKKGVEERGGGRGGGKGEGGEGGRRRKGGMCKILIDRVIVKEKCSRSAERELKEIFQP